MTEMSGSMFFYFNWSRSRNSAANFRRIEIIYLSLVWDVNIYLVDVDSTSESFFFFEKLISVSDRKQYRFLFERKLGSHRVVVSRPTDIFLRNNCWGAITWGKSYFARLRSLFMGLDKRQRMTSDIECFRYCVLRIKAKLIFLGKATN